MYRVALLTLAVQGAHMGSRVIASLLAIRLGANEATIGMLIAAYSLFPLLLCVLCGRLSDRYGTRRPMLAGSVALLAGLLLPWLRPELSTLFVSAMLIGIGFVFFNVSVQNLTGAMGPADDRTRRFSLLGIGYSGGHMVGPMAAGYAIDHYSHTAAYLVMAALSVLPIVLLSLDRTLEVRNREAPSDGTSTLGLLREPKLAKAILISALVTSGWDLYSFYVPIYGSSINLSATTIGQILAIFATATFVTRFTLPRFTRRFGVEPMLAGAVLTAAALLLVFPFVTFVPLLFILSAGIGLALGCGQPLTLTITYNRSPAGRPGEVAGLRLTMNNVMHIAVPLGAGAVGAVLGVAPVFWVNAVMLATSGYLTRKG